MKDQRVHVILQMFTSLGSLQYTVTILAVVGSPHLPALLVAAHTPLFFGSAVLQGNNENIPLVFCYTDSGFIQ